MRKNENKADRRRTSRINKKDSRRIEKAINFLSEKYRQSGFNEKPVVLHSLRVAFGLMYSGAKPDAVIIAVLHDLIEDSDTDYSEIERLFGGVIARGVMSLTEDNRIKKYKERYKENFKRIIEAGDDVIAIKLADLYDNSFYIRSLKDKKKQKLVIDKMGHFLDLTKNRERSEAHESLEERYAEELKRFSKIKNR